MTSMQIKMIDTAVSIASIVIPDSFNLVCLFILSFKKDGVLWRIV
jgi:hypothetical protein